MTSGLGCGKRSSGVVSTTLGLVVVLQPWTPSQERGTESRSRQAAKQTGPEFPGQERSHIAGLEVTAERDLSAFSL